MTGPLVAALFGAAYLASTGAIAWWIAAAALGHPVNGVSFAASFVWLLLCMAVRERTHRDRIR